ncbi:hypothetical protein FBUS_03285 [Fasciolopsis buskii]|uniref:Uncharacterized protein n=1 Tax=Fasciolopsis buskii TaxID=27845 RepID=A0A8E0VH18_9TREM|nr:hypothetical protein FBUS_03285 [Fasciolopsis buski]
MHSSCVYLLELHQSISSLESAVKQLCQCVNKRPSWDVNELAEDEENWTPQGEWDPSLSGLKVSNADGGVGKNSFEHPDDDNIDADYYGFVSLGCRKL